MSIITLYYSDQVIVLLIIQGRSYRQAATFSTGIDID